MVRTPPEKPEKKPELKTVKEWDKVAGRIEPAKDPLQINIRIYRQLAILLDQLEQGEHVTLKERFQALMAIARIQYVFVNLRKEKVGNDDAAGSSVRKYAQNFKANDPRRGKKNARSAARPEPDGDTWFEREDDDGDDAA